MPLLHNYLFDELLIPIMYAFFLVSGIVGLTLGIALAVFRTRVFRLFKPMNRWVSARKQLRPMPKVRPTMPDTRKNAYMIGIRSSSNR